MVGGIDHGADGVVDQDDVVALSGGQRGEGVGDGVLAIVAAGDDVDFFGELVLGDHERRRAFLLRVADGDVDAGYGADVRGTPAASAPGWEGP
jgi:hypothetical protein